MATDLTCVKPAPSKYDAFVAEQLAKAEGRIRLLDLTAGLLGFAALSLVYFVGVVLCDRQFMLAPHSRQLALYLFLVGGGIYLFFAVVRPLRMRVNPYFAARQVEAQLPHAKNSIVNWVDLHAEPLPPAIRGALGQRAAKDLSHVDLDAAISGRRAAWMGGWAALGALAFVIAFFAVGPAPFASLLRRALNPFAQTGVSTRTQLTILKPESGDAVLTLGRGLSFNVAVNGKVPQPKDPDAAKLLYRHEESDPWLERLLIQEPSREWSVSLSALEVKNGFWYKITGGDAETPEYRVSVRAAPAINDFLATYVFRHYMARADEVRRERDLKELRGTEVRLRVRTNRTLRDGRLEFEGKKGSRTERGVVDPTDPQVMHLRWQLEEEGKYRLHFTSTDGEAYSDSSPHAVTVIPDNPPSVELTKPGTDIHLPADGLLELEGKATDDLGVKSLVLQMRIVGGDRLREKSYRSDEKLRLPDGGYPRSLEYKDFVEMSNVHNKDGQAYPLHGGMELEYWLEAGDACDFPRANVAQSKHYRVLLTEPEKKSLKNEQAKRQAEKAKQQHEKNQDQQIQQENQQRQDQRQKQEARNKEEENKSKETGDKQAQPKQDEQTNNGESKDSTGQSQENKDGQGDNQNEKKGEKNEQSKDDQKTEEQIKKALENREAQENAGGEGKPDTGENKKDSQNNPGGAKSQSENKEAGKQADNELSQGKDKGQPQSGTDESKGDGKGDHPMNQTGVDKTGDGKREAEPASKPSGEGTPNGEKQVGKDTGQAKPQPKGAGSENAQGEAKPIDEKGSQPKREGTAEAKEGVGPRNDGTSRSESKDERKQAGPAPKDGQKKSESTPSTDKTDGSAKPKSEGKPDAGAKNRNATAKDIAELARKLQSKDEQERAEAKRQLQQIEQQAHDPQGRAKAEEELDKAGRPDGGTDSGTPKPNHGTGDKTDGRSKSGEKKDGANESASGAKNEVQAKKPGEKSEKNGNGKEDSGSSGAAPGKQGSQSGSPSGGGGEQRDGAGDGDRPGTGQADKTSPSTNSSRPRAHRATQMQLEDFAKRVNKDILRDAGVTEEAWKKYLESKRKLLTPRETPRADVPGNPQQARTLPSMGGRTISSSSSNPSDATNSDRGQPPPGYRDPYREFTRKMTDKNK